MCFTVRVMQYIQSTYFFCGSSHVYTYDTNLILHTDLYTSETHCLIIFQNRSKELKKTFLLSWPAVYLRIMACHLGYSWKPVCVSESLPWAGLMDKAKSMTAAWRPCLPATGLEVGGLLEIHFQEGWLTVVTTLRKVTEVGIPEWGQPEGQPAWTQVQTARDIAWPLTTGLESSPAASSIVLLVGWWLKLKNRSTSQSFKQITVYGGTGSLWVQLGWLF